MINNILALDIGQKRIGVARANAIARIPVALATLPNDGSLDKRLEDIIREYEIDLIVVGLPRGLGGDETEQSRITRDFVSEKLSDYKVVWQDETLTTVSAEAQAPSGFGIDADAACIILSDYLQEQYEV